ncbi:NAD-dependent epimerase/dehydratase family protein [Salinispira pacifica]
MKVLVTGACGSIGSRTVDTLAAAGHTVRGTDLPSRRNVRLAKRARRRFGDRVEHAFGDLRSAEFVERTIDGTDAVIHLAAMIPPAADLHPELAESINVGITRTLVSAMEAARGRPRLVYTSSIAVYGDRVRSPLITDRDEPSPNGDDGYAGHKLACEKLIRESGLDWTILRLSYIVSPDRMVMDPLMFRMPLATSIEPCHAADAALACATAAAETGYESRTLLIGGGPKMRCSYAEYLDAALRDFGLGRLFLPPEAFAVSGYHCGFMETDESERLLRYQRHTLEDLHAEIRRIWRWKRSLLLLIRPAARLYLLGRSPYLRRYMSEHYRNAARRFYRTVQLSLGMAPRRSVGV